MKECFECSSTEDLQEHHVIPKSRGGTKTITLCSTCHRRAHGSDNKEGINFSSLTKTALQVAKKRGVKLGSNNPIIQKKIIEATKQRGNRTKEAILPMIQECFSNGLTRPTDIVEFLNNNECYSPRSNPWTKGSIHRFIAMAREKNKEAK